MSCPCISFFSSLSLEKDSARRVFLFFLFTTTVVVVVSFYNVGSQRAEALLLIMHKPDRKLSVSSIHPSQCAPSGGGE